MSELDGHGREGVNVREGDGRAHLLGVGLGDVEACDEPGGWPEFTVTVRFYVASDDPEVIETERRRVFEQDWQPGP